MSNVTYLRFSPEQQATHCRQLAELLDSDRIKGHYIHETYYCGTAGCALGWAAHAHIGGLKLKCDFPHMDGVYSEAEAADRVFGRGAYERIFSTERATDKDDDPWHKALDSEWMRRPSQDALDAYNEQARKNSIALLKEQAALLETQPELA
jgi:hypothetical protein